MSAKPDLKPKTLTPQQIAIIIEAMEQQAALSITSRCNQTLEFVFKGGHIEFINQSHNRRIPADTDLVMNDDYTWNKETK